MLHLGCVTHFQSHYSPYLIGICNQVCLMGTQVTVTWMLDSLGYQNLAPEGLASLTRKLHERWDYVTAQMGWPCWRQKHLCSFSSAVTCMQSDPTNVNQKEPLISFLLFCNRNHRHKHKMFLWSEFGTMLVPEQQTRFGRADRRKYSPGSLVPSEGSPIQTSLNFKKIF